MKKILLLIIIFSTCVMPAKSQSCGLICNGDFELPALGHWAQVFDSTIPCWHTTEPDSIMEIWPTGYNGVPAYHGLQFIEMDANFRPTIYQNFNVTPGITITIGFAHRGRAGVDTMSLSIGPVGGPYTTLGTYADGTAAWGYYTVNYTVPLTLGHYYSLRLNAINSVAGPTIGNFLDDVSVTGAGGLPATIASNNVTCFNAADGNATITVTSGAPPYTYAWSPSGGTNMTATGLVPGSYTCVVTDAVGCTAMDSVIITEPTALTAATTMTPATCLGNTGTAKVIVGGGTLPYTYLWNPSGQTIPTAVNLSAGSYSVIVTDNNGCTASGNVTVTVDSGSSTLSASISGASSICAGMSTTLCADIRGGANVNAYLWEPGNLSTPCITVSPGATTTYTLSLTGNCGTTTTIAILPVNPLPDVNFTANLYQGCVPLCIQFNNNTTVSKGSLESYVWAFGNGDTLQSDNAVYCYPSSGIYNVSLTVVSDSGCSSTLKKINMITAFAHPNAAYTYSPQSTTILLPTIQFNDKSSTTDTIVYRWWSFGDATDSISTLTNPIHTYQDTGNYCPKLTIMDIHGCTDTAMNCLVINPDFTLYIPSAFSPNADGLNEVFQPKGRYIKSFEMYIFDRWGMQIFHSTNIANGWNGTLEGSTIAQEDTYVYRITVTDTRNNQHLYVGNVTLLK